MAERMEGWLNILWSIGKPSETAPLLRPRGFMREVAKTFVLPVWQKQRSLSKQAMSSKRKGQGRILFVIDLTSKS
jgi:hypothetical protein